MIAKIFEIKRFAVHDGDGIRTTVFFKGCPLKCIWCHNPEGISVKSELAYFSHKCISCGECVSVCPTGAHSIESGQHVFLREKCIACGKCENACLGKALTLYGKETSIEELMPVLLQDKAFYESTGGGVTLSGGECLLQTDFCVELLKQLKRAQIHTAVDTCGFITQSAIDKVAPYVDVFLYDIKTFEEDAHIVCTGQSNKIILENLKYIDATGKNIEIRIPYIPEYNDEELKKIGHYISRLKNITKVKVLPYHNYAKAKYDALDMENTLPERLPMVEEIKQAEELLKSFGLNVV